MKPRKPLPRSTAPIRRSRVRKVNATRKAREFQRAYGGKHRVAWLQSFNCCVVALWHDGPTECAHIRGGGAGRKSDAKYTVPLCHHHHVDLHLIGRQTFERKYGINLDRPAAFYAAAWQCEQLKTRNVD